MTPGAPVMRREAASARKTQYQIATKQPCIYAHPSAYTFTAKLALRQQQQLHKSTDHPKSNGAALYKYREITTSSSVLSSPYMR